ncbi:MAG: ECF transporter S component [Clostridia bacterium]|nr:ECF transporter S component [Clostridia bacterium]
MDDRRIRILVASGILAAVIFVLTAFLRVPIPAGYLHLGDTGVFFAAMLLPPGVAVLCAGLGSALADLIGFPVYVPVTFLVKGLAALTFSLLWQRRDRLRYLAFLAILVIPVGYFLFELILFRNYAWIDLPLNLLQSAVGAGLAFALDRAGRDRIRL